MTSKSSVDMYSCTTCQTCGTTVNLNLVACAEDYKNSWAYLSQSITCCDRPSLSNPSTGPDEVLVHPFHIILDNEDAPVEKKVTRFDLVIQGESL